jgi:hypothetical protein
LFMGTPFFWIGLAIVLVGMLKHDKHQEVKP